MSKKTGEFTWLHLSDLHAGMSSHQILWPNIKSEFYKDLSSLHEQTGKWDAVVFTGDLTQKGTQEEFEELLQILNELWSKFRELGFEPLFFCVPGNHDLVRPSKISAEGIILKKWWDTPEVQNDFWKNNKSQYRKLVKDAFKNYEKFISDLKSIGIPVGDVVDGALPGDRSLCFNVRGLNVGVLGLNSTWLQLGDEDYEGRLNIDMRQISPISSSGTVSWCESHDINFLVTHHPREWLHDDALRVLDSEINPPGRFDAHLFGHMHEPDSKNYSHGGGDIKVEIQAASLFGLEYIRGEEKRIHGYSVGRIVLGDNLRRMTIWPRTTMRQVSKQWKIVPDHQFTLDKDNSYSVEYKSYLEESKVKQVKPDPVLLEKPIEDKGASSSTLNKIYYALGSAEAHLFIRGGELNKAVEGFGTERCVWMVSEWGMGVDGFLWAVKNRLGHDNQKVYSLDLGECRSGEDFLESIREKFGCSFAQLCNYLSDQGDSYLILNDIHSVGEDGTGGVVFRAIEDITQTVIQYCINLKVVLGSRQKPRHSTYNIVELLPLDQADALTYIQNHPQWTKTRLGLESVSEIYSLSDGAPQLIDTILSDLEYVDLSDLVSMSANVENVVAEISNTPASLVRTIKSLADSNSNEGRRAFQLLKALSVFPNGEGLERLRNFDQRQPFFPPQARALAELSLIDVSSVISDVEYGGKNTKALVVRRAVRDYVLSEIGAAEYIELCKRAASLYFGAAWQQGKIKINPRYKFDSVQTSGGDIGNANKILKVLFVDAFANGTKPYRKKVVDVCAHFLNKLGKGSHYREIQSFCEGAIPHMEDDTDPFLMTLKFQLAKSKRMLSASGEAKDILIELSASDYGKQINAQVLLNLALCHETLKEYDEVLSTARLIKKINPGSSVARYAESLIVENDRQETNVAQKLKKLELIATAKKEFSTANNISLTLAAKTQDLTEKVELYEKVLARARAYDDDYNAIRAVVNLCLSKIDAGHPLNANEEQNLIRAYHYLYNQRLGALFNKCHSALWYVFYTKKDFASLLRLFRHSSLVWRLGGQDDKELEYVKMISKSSETVSFKAVGSSSSELAYVLSRTSLLA